MARFFYSVGRTFQFIGIVFTCLSLLLFGKGGSMGPPMFLAVIGGVWFIAGWLIVKSCIPKLGLQDKKEKKKQ